jgi:hypothetical protein
MAQLMMVAGVHKTERLSGYCYMNLLGTLTGGKGQEPLLARPQTRSRPEFHRLPLGSLDPDGLAALRAILVVLVVLPLEEKTRNGI